MKYEARRAGKAVAYFENYEDARNFQVSLEKGIYRGPYKMGEVELYKIFSEEVTKMEIWNKDRCLRR